MARPSVGMKPCGAVRWTGCFGVIWLTGLLAALSPLPADTFQGQGWSTLYKSLAPRFPPYVRATIQLSGYWTWSELVTMLLNRNRRALHDFIGSTRVIRIVGRDGGSVDAIATREAG
jgi:uncharacterized RDD family membrane protein YckC